MKKTVAEESTTHPEGAIIRLVLYHNILRNKPPSGMLMQISAWKGDDKVIMRMEESCAPHNLRAMLDLCCREIARIRKEGLSADAQADKPKTMREFVAAMSSLGMFLPSEALA